MLILKIPQRQARQPMFRHGLEQCRERNLIATAPLHLCLEQHEKTWAAPTFRSLRKI